MDIDCGGLKVTARSNGSSAGDAFLSVFAKVCQEMREEVKQWVEELRSRGVKAARHDDGWVDREKNTVLIWPHDAHFNDGAGLGDVIALGSPKKYRLVRLIGVDHEGVNEPYWLFQEEV
jgi:hypothetical protein